MACCSSSSRLPEERRGRSRTSSSLNAGGARVRSRATPLSASRLRPRSRCLSSSLRSTRSHNQRITDLLTGAAQGDDLTHTMPPSAVVHLQKAIARVRFSVELEDPADPHAAASLAIAEVLDPAGDVVALKAVVARASSGSGGKLGSVTRARFSPSTGWRARPMMRSGMVRGMLAAGLVVSLAGCGGSSYSSPFVSCSTTQRHFDLTGTQHGSPALLGVARVGTGSVLYARGRSGVVYASRSRARAGSASAAVCRAFLAA